MRKPLLDLDISLFPREDADVFALSSNFILDQYKLYPNLQHEKWTCTLLMTDSGGAELTIRVEPHPKTTSRMAPWKFLGLLLVLIVCAGWLVWPA